MPIAEHPLAPAVISGNTITVDSMMQQPTRITSFLSDITLQRFFADQVLNSAGGITGGAVVFDRPTVNELYLERDVEEVGVGSEFPILTSARRVPDIAFVKKYGGRVWISDEARDRNNIAVFNRELRQLGNTLIRKMDQLLMAQINKLFTDYPSQVVANGFTWGSTVLNGSTPSAPTSTPAATFANVQLKAELDELGMTYDRVALHPTNYATLSLLYGADLPSLFSAYGLTPYVTPRVTVGQAIFWSAGQVGEIRIEKPLGTETWREIETERNWVQASVRPAMYIVNQYAMVKVTGI